MIDNARKRDKIATTSEPILLLCSPEPTPSEDQSLSLRFSKYSEGVSSYVREVKVRQSVFHPAFFATDFAT
jgi:hypothetical protein